MARPKANTKAGKIASEKWRKTMEEKYGSVTEKMRECGRIGGLNGKGPDYKGGFAADRERAKIAGAKGGKKSRRLPAERTKDGKAIRKDGTPYAEWPKRDQQVRKPKEQNERIDILEHSLTFEDIYEELNNSRKNRRNFFARLFRK